MGLPIKSVRIGRDPLNNISRGVCYLDMNNTGDAMRLFAGLSDAGLLNIDDREVLVSYCKLASSALTAATVASLTVKTSTPAAITAVAAAQWSVNSSSSNSGRVPQAASGNNEVNFSREEIPSATAGLGMKTYAVAGDDYRQSVKKLAMMRFKEL